MRSITALICSLLFALQAAAQSGTEFKLALDGFRAAMAAKQAYDSHQEAKSNRERIDFLDSMHGNIDELLLAAANIDERTKVIENLVVYNELQRETQANSSRLQSYLRSCITPSEFCERELASLTNEVRSISAEVRTLPLTEIAIPLVISSQETELFLADYTSSDVWFEMIKVDYGNYWDGITSSKLENSLFLSLRSLEKKQAEAIKSAFSEDFSLSGVASREEFEELNSWISDETINNIQLPGYLGCVIVMNPPLFQRSRQADHLSVNGHAHFLFNFVRPALDHQNDATTKIRFEIKTNYLGRKYTKADKAKYSANSNSYPKCVSFFAKKKNIQATIEKRVAAHFESIARDINEPAQEIIELRSMISLGELGRYRLSSAI